MGSSISNTDRYEEIVHFFYLILGNRIHGGMDSATSRKEAYDAVSLRYGISQRTLQNIISKNKISRSVKLLPFIQNSRNLIDELTAANSEMKMRIERNEKLIVLLNECIDG